MTNDKLLNSPIDVKENHKTTSKSVTSEEEMYAKFTLGSKKKAKAVQRFWVSHGIVRIMKCVLVLRKLLKAQEISLTKRGLLSLLASMFDPMGLISPVIVCIKMLFQDEKHKKSWMGRQTQRQR